MLTEERYATILHILDEKKAVSVLDLTKILNASESTVRRDLTTLHKDGRLCKVYGGATALDNAYTTKEEDMQTRSDLHRQEKRVIGRRAARLVSPKDFIYLDAGSTTLAMIDFIDSSIHAAFVTNGIIHAARLAERGMKVFILGGAVKPVTEAVIGTEALNSLKAYNFTKGFFGTNGISMKSGYSTPDSGEAVIKGSALSRCTQAFVLADSSKFSRISPISFANLSDAAIITDCLPDKKYRNHTTILEGESN